MDPNFEPEGGDEAREVFPTIVPLDNGGHLIFPDGVDVFARKAGADLVCVGPEGEVTLANHGDYDWRDFFVEEPAQVSPIRRVQ